MVTLHVRGRGTIFRICLSPREVPLAHGERIRRLLSGRSAILAGCPGAIGIAPTSPRTSRGKKDQERQKRRASPLRGECAITAPLAGFFLDGFLCFRGSAATALFDSRLLEFFFVGAERAIDLDVIFGRANRI